MAFIIETKNPFQPFEGLRKHCHPGGISIRGWLQTTYPGFIEFTDPTICLVNGEPVLRRDWDREIRPNDIVNFVVVAGWVAAIIIIVAIVLAIVLALVLTPTVPGALPASDPVFSVKGQQNDIRLGEPIEVNYGRNRIYPSFAARPFFRYVDNDQFQFSLYCVGQGTYEVDEIRIGDTEISEYEEVTWELLDPGDSTTLFHTNVQTSVEVASQILYQPGEANYPLPDGWIGPFPANSSGTEIFRIEVDIIFPRGVYHQSNKGRMETVTIAFEVQARLIDNAGAPLGGWTTIFSPSITMATTTAQRITYSVDVALGRYEVRSRRTSTATIDARTQSETIWEGLRGFVDGDEPDYGDLTMVAVKIRATSNLNSNTQRKLNVIATRKLPIRESGGFSAPVATRSIIWAFVDIFRNANYGGRLVDENFYDWDALEALDSLYESRGEHFDWTFRDPLTVWDAARMVARVGRGLPMLVGSLVTLKRDGPLTLPVTMFTPENIVKGSFEWQIKLWEPADHDSVSIEYTEVATGYKQEQVIATLPGGTSDNPEDIRFPGIQNRDHAYHEGLYMLASRKYLRENITFETGMEGFLPSYGDLVAISHDLPQWGQSGFIVSVDKVGDDYLLYVSEPLVFEDGFTYQILLRDKRGDIIGPVTATQTPDSKQVVVTLDEEPDFLLGGASEPMLFLFGKTGNVTKYGKVVKMEPQGGERVRITLVNDAPIIHTFDDEDAPPLLTPSVPPVMPDLPVVEALYLTRTNVPESNIVATWPPALGAQSYIVQTSVDGTSWENRGTVTRPTIALPVLPGTLYVRVAGINNGQGPWIQEISLFWILEDTTWNDDGYWLDGEFWYD